MSNQTQTELSIKAKENLQRNAELREKDNKFIKLQSGEKKVLIFDPEKIEQVEAEFSGKKSMRFRYTVVEEHISLKNIVLFSECYNCWILDCC